MAKHELHFTIQYRDGLRWYHGKTFGLDFDLPTLEEMCRLWQRQDSKHRPMRVLLMPVNFLIASTEESWTSS